LSRKLRGPVMPTRRQTLALMAATATTSLTAPALVGCGPAKSSAAKGLDNVSYVTGFGAFGREAYAWVADKKGFFEDAGIKVSIKLGAAGDTNLKLLAADQAQFVVIDYSGAVVRAGQGNFGDFRCIGAVNQRTIIALMALQGKGINSPRDLAGKTVAQAVGAVPKTLFPAYARLAGFDPKSVKWEQTNPQQLPALLATGKVDAIGQFVVGAPAVQGAAHGRKVVVLPYSNYLTDLYGNTLVTTTKIIKEKPSLVRRFTDALMKGLQYSVDHPEEAGEILHKAVPTTPAATATAELKIMKDYVGTPLGAFDQHRVVRSIALIQGVGLIPHGYDPTQLVDFDAVPAGGANTK
jgi:NitT/TauT family transport system substrate-binding protein